MKISEFNHHLASFEKFIHVHHNPNITNNYHFLTQRFKVYSCTKILNGLEALSSSMKKKGGPLDSEDKRKIYSVLYYMKGITKGKIQNKYTFRTKHTDAELEKRLEQIQSLLTRLGITRESLIHDEETRTPHRRSSSV